MKRTALLSIVMILLLMLLTGCESDPYGGNGDYTPVGTGTITQKDSEGLAFSLSSNGKVYHLSGIGSCKDKNIKVPSTYNSKPVTAVKEEAFKGSEITSIVFPQTIVTVSSSAFEGSLSLKKVVFSEGLTDIEIGAFRNCSSLETLILPKSLERIEVEAFSYCIKIKELIIPESVRTIQGNAFLGCSFDRITVADKNNYFSSLGNCLTDKSGETLHIGTATTVIPKTVKEIKSYAFSGCLGLTEITIPGNVTDIGEFAFLGCIDLKKVTIKEGTISIAKGAFSECTSLEELYLPATVQSISNSFIDSTPSLKSITVAKRNEIYSSEGNCFTRKTNLGGTLLRGFSSAVIPDYVNAIESYAFCGTGITSINIPASVTDIGSGAFSGCDKLTEVTFEEGSETLSIGYESFMGTQISELVFPLRLSSISTGAFMNCTRLSKVTFNKDSDLLYIERNVFSGSAIESLAIPKAKSLYHDAFLGCSKLKEISLSRGERGFSVYVFDECTSLETVYFSGTRSEWEYYASKGERTYGFWYADCPNVKVICSDGTITYK